MSSASGLTPTGSLATLTRLYRPIVADLQHAERIFDAELTSAIPFIRELVAHLGHYRGKRLRSALLLLTGKACGPVRGEHHTLGAVVEMIHTATLVHDDVLDHASLRRHVPTIHAKWGNAASVLLGDLLFTHAFYLTSTTGSAEACRLIGEATNRVCAGELQQVGSRGNLELTEAEYYAIIQGKTAELTACCCRLGALFSGAEPRIVEALYRYGLELGMAFQIADDLLDLIGQEELVGKSLGTDLEQRKMTLPLIHLLQSSSVETGQHVRSLIGDSAPQAQTELRRRLRESGALAHAQQQAELRAARAREELRVLPPSESRQILEDLTGVVVHRSS